MNKKSSNLQSTHPNPELNEPQEFFHQEAADPSIHAVPRTLAITDPASSS